MTTPTTDPGIRCRDQCGSAVADQEAALQAGWSCLQITGWWCCGPCGAALRAVAHLIGPDGPSVDTLPPDSRGALPRETASTITAPALKG